MVRRGTAPYSSIINIVCMSGPFSSMECSDYDLVCRTQYEFCAAVTVLSFHSLQTSTFFTLRSASYARTYQESYIPTIISSRFQIPRRFLHSFAHLFTCRT